MSVFNYFLQFIVFLCRFSRVFVLHNNQKNFLVGRNFPEKKSEKKPRCRWMVFNSNWNYLRSRRNDKNSCRSLYLLSHTLSSFWNSVKNNWINRWLYHRKEAPHHLSTRNSSWPIIDLWWDSILLQLLLLRISSPLFLYSHHIFQHFHASVRFWCTAFTTQNHQVNSGLDTMVAACSNSHSLHNSENKTVETLIFIWFYGLCLDLADFYCGHFSFG